MTVLHFDEWTPQLKTDDEIPQQKRTTQGYIYHGIMLQIMRDIMEAKLEFGTL